MRHDWVKPVALSACSAYLVVAAIQSTAAPPAGSPAADHARIVAHWTPERMAAAIPRDLRIDARGLGYLQRPDGSLQPYGHSIAAETKPASPQPMARPGGDTTAPVISNRDPATGATIGASYTFKATVTDTSGIRSVNFKVGPEGGLQRSFAAAAGANNVYSVALTGFTNGNWTWSVVAKDTANNTATSPVTAFVVNTGGGGGGGNVVPNAEYTSGGDIQDAAGRIYFEMPSNDQRTRWTGYVCSGTVVRDSTTGRSIVQTAAHCVYDDEHKAFARNVLFIPDQADTSGSGTDLNCSNDPFGCWTPTFGVVDVNWTTRTFPDNVTWDYAYYVVNDASGHSGAGGGSGAVLDSTVPSIPISFAVPNFDVANSSSDYTTALGYSYDVDPQFMYCAEDMHQLDQANWWLGNCDLSGGSSGGAWMQPFSGGTGSLISVNSWGYTSSPGMAGPKLSGTSASCVFSLAKSRAFTSIPTTDGDEGATFTSNCP
jgi:hypothetical protein